MFTFGNGGRCAQVFDTRIGAGADEYFVYANFANWRIRLQTHVSVSTLPIGFLHGIFSQIQTGYTPVYGHHHFRRGAPSDLRLNVFGLQAHHQIELCPHIGLQGAPISHGGIPLICFRRVRAAFNVINGGVIHRHHTGTRTGFNRHIAKRHAPFHGQTAYCRTSKFNGITIAASGAGFTYDG